jgi:hypothetical protein
MNRIFCLIFYILFMHVYPNVHLHVHEHDDLIGLRLSVHPPDLEMETHGHNNQMEAHAHDASHFVGNWEFVSHCQINLTLLSVQAIDLHVEVAELDPQLKSRRLWEYPLKLPADYSRSTDSGRAPPCYA